MPNPTWFCGWGEAHGHTLAFCCRSDREKDPLFSVHCLEHIDSGSCSVIAKGGGSGLRWVAKCGGGCVCTGGAVRWFRTPGSPCVLLSPQLSACGGFPHPAELRPSQGAPLGDQLFGSRRRAARNFLPSCVGLNREHPSDCAGRSQHGKACDLLFAKHF